MIAQVLVDVKAKNVNKTYDYLIPDEFKDFLEIGARVVVPFGSRKIMGFILSFSLESEYSDKLKSIIKVLDIESYLNKELVDIAKEISKESNTLLIRVLETILPSALKVVYKPKIKVVDFDNLPDELTEIFKFKNQVYLDNIPQDKFALINQEIKKNNLVQSYEVKEKQSNLVKRFVRRTSKKAEKITDKQRIVLDYLDKCDKKEELLKILMNKTSSTRSVINTLEKHDYLEFFDAEVYRKVETIYRSEKKDVELNEKQKDIYEKIISSNDKENIFLLHGVTGSGKTEIYLKVIEHILKQGKNVLLLVPEISLTPMMISRFKSKFESLVAVLHSGLSSNEKYDEWRRIIRKEARIDIGAR